MKTKKLTLQTNAIARQILMGKNGKAIYDLYLAFVFLRSADKATVPIGLLNFFQRSSVDWPTLLAALTTVTVPVLILFTLFQRRFVEGYTAGAVK